MLKNKKLEKKVLLIILFFLVLGLFLFLYFNWKVETAHVKINSGAVTKAKSVTYEANLEQSSNVENDGNYLIEGITIPSNDNELATSDALAAMEQNTIYLQKLIDTADDGQVIEIPAGVYYFVSGGINSRNSENYVIKVRSNVKIVGAGTNEQQSDEYTVLKPYSYYNADVNSKYYIKNGLDMFYYNNYHDSMNDNGIANADMTYIEDADFSDFVIDSEKTRGHIYNSSGKGFMINLCRNCDWDNVVVKNTDGTGFGVDSVINSTIKNSVAIHCGKNATPTDVGASGFGIGTGLSDDESMLIENCKSIGNAKFGYFFEHQNRFSSSYPATKSDGFVVVNSTASGNLYNFGGERANDVTYIGCTTSPDDTWTQITYPEKEIYFSDQSRRIRIVDFKTQTFFNDVSKDKYYYKPVYWATSKDIIEIPIGQNFGVNDKVTRADAITMLWKMAERNGEVLTKDTLDSNSNDKTNIVTQFDDVLGDATYAGAVKWALDNKIVTGSTNSLFNPNTNIIRADFITMLYRYSKEQKPTTKVNFKDVKENDYYYDAISWAVSKKIATGIKADYFYPEKEITKEDIVTFLYRYSQSTNTKFSISYSLMGGKADNPTEYISSKEEITLKSPVKLGYEFIGWIGSNGKTPEKDVTITESDTGNKTYVARYKANKYNIKFDANGGSGTMDNITANFNSFAKLPKNNYTRSGYQFMGWSELKDGTVDYENEANIKNLTTDNDETVTLYAVWVKGGKSKNIFVGDSLTYEMHSVIGDNNDNSWYARRGEGLDWFKGVVPNFEKDIDSKTNIIINIGTNDLFNPDLGATRDTSVDEIITNYINYFQDKVSTWQKQGATVYFVSVGPFDYQKLSSSSLITKEKTEEFNKNIKPKLEALNIEFIDLTSQMDITNLTRTDGIHGIALYYENKYSVLKENLGQNYIPTYDAVENITDVKSKYTDALTWALKNAYIATNTSRLFVPEQSVKREEVISLLWKYKQLEFHHAQKEFTDVKESDYAYSAISWAVANKITSGTTDTEFSPDSNCSIASYLTFIYRMAGSPSVSKTYDLNNIDSDSYYYMPINWAIEKGIIDFDPTYVYTTNLTKIEAIDILYKFNNLNK